MNSEPELPEANLTCVETRDLLFLFITDELEPDEFMQVASHLATCAGCRKAMQEHMKLLGILEKHLPGMEAPIYSENN